MALRGAGSPEGLDVEVTEESFDIVFAEDPESRFFLHGPKGIVAVSQPGKKTVAPRIDRIRRIQYAEGRHELVVEWTMSNGEVERATFVGMDRATWERLKAFVQARVEGGAGVLEEHAE